MSTSFSAHLLVEAITDSMAEKSALKGIEALVRRHYANYTDATHLDAAFERALLYVAREADLDEEDVFEVIRDAELDINDAGGIVGSDGRAHTVRTPIAYEGEDEGEEWVACPSCGSGQAPGDRCTTCGWPLNT